LEENLGVAFWSGPDLIPISQSFPVVMLLLHPSHPAFDLVIPDKEFTIREGEKIVAHGKVVKRWTETPTD
jgi:hypothetical protein